MGAAPHSAARRSGQRPRPGPTRVESTHRHPARQSSVSPHTGSDRWQQRRPSAVSGGPVTPAVQPAVTADTEPTQPTQPSHSRHGRRIRPGSGAPCACHCVVTGAGQATLISPALTTRTESASRPDHVHRPPSLIVPIGVRSDPSNTIITHTQSDRTDHRARLSRHHHRAEVRTISVRGRLFPYISTGAGGPAPNFGVKLPHRWFPIHLDRQNTLI